MDSRIRNRISSLFSSSLGSSCSRNLSDIMRKVVISPQNKKGHAMIESLSPKCPDKEFNSDTEFFQFGIRENEKRAKRASKKNKSRAKSRNIELYPLNSSSHSHDTNFQGWFSSEDETETLVSSKSVSSSSSQPHRRGRRVARKQRAAKSYKKEIDISLHRKVKDSFALVKQSSDPYSDFRTSMVEMIVEKQIVAAQDLEQLLQCFLSLNSVCYHRVIIEVFIEICETLMHNC